MRAHTPGQVILSGNSRLRISGHWLVVDGLRFQNGYYTNSDVIQFRENSSALATNCALINTFVGCSNKTLGLHPCRHKLTANEPDARAFLRHQRSV